MVKRIVAFILLSLVVLPFLARGLTALSAQGRIYSEAAYVPRHAVAIVYGAGVRNDEPSTVLYDRVASAVELYRDGKVGKLLMSGDNRFENYNEPGVMRQTALRLGVPGEDISMDYAGRSTYDTCFRARNIFGLSDAVLVTQDFHLDRAVFTCRVLGVNAIGYAADRRNYRGMSWFQVREIGATVKALLELFVIRPQPVLGDKIPISSATLLDRNV